MSTSVDLILTNGIVVTMNTGYDIIRDGAVAIKDDSIVDIGESGDITKTYQASEIIDCAGCAIIPGLVNAHTHIPMTLMRGLNDDLRLDVWLGYLMPLEREFVTPSFVRLGTRMACAEMIRSGVTSFADMYYFEDEIAEETAEIGMRALVGQTILTFPAPDAETYEDGLILCRRMIERWKGHHLISPAVAPHAWYTATPELLTACADLARAFDVPLHTHIAETGLEVKNCRRDHHVEVVPWVQRHGVLDTKLLAAHCVHLDTAELYRLKDANASVAHCPSSNLKLASGIAPVGKMLSIGLKVGVGTDGPASNNNLDMFEEVHLAALLAKTASNDPTTLPARQALELATIGGARAIYMDEITGSLEVGKRADIAVVDLTGVHTLPHFGHNSEGVYSQLIYAAGSKDVQHVICNGNWLMKDKVLLTIDEEKVLEQATAVAIEIDSFVHKRESSPYNKLVLLSGVERQESFEVQVKVPASDDSQILAMLNSNKVQSVRKSHYQQYDHYFIFDGDDPDAAMLRYREDETLGESATIGQVRTRLTLIGEEKLTHFGNAVTLSRSRFLAGADRSLRFYREYFDAPVEQEVIKERRRWHIRYRQTDFAVNLDKLSEPELPGFYLEIKSRTWSRSDAERKANLMVELLSLFELDPSTAEEKEYPLIALSLATEAE